MGCEVWGRGTAGRRGCGVGLSASYVVSTMTGREGLGLMALEVGEGQGSTPTGFRRRLRTSSGMGAHNRGEVKTAEACVASVE